MDHHPALHFLNLHFVLLANINMQGTTVLIIILLTLLFFSFVISGSEVAFFSLTYKDINLLKTKQLGAYKRIIDLLEEPKILLGALLIANSFINIAIIIISNILIGNAFDFQKVNAAWLEFGIKVVSVTFLLLLFGEIMPKVLATQNNIRFAKEAGPLIELVFYTCKRMSIWLVKYSDIIEKKLSNKNNPYSLEELDHAIDLTSSTDASVKEKNILKGIIKFGNITVKQIMKTRVDVNGVNNETSFPELLKLVGELHYSRLPVYEEDLDKVVGMIHTKDLIPHLEQPDNFDWHTLIRQAFFVHEQKMIEDLLKEFQTKRTHFAVVVDEFGGTSGIVTLEDILEEVIGDIKDEFDEEEVDYKKIDDNNYLFEGRTMLNDVCKAMDLVVDTFDALKGESDSLAGLVLELAGEIPIALQVVPCGDFEFTVLEVVKNRIQKIKVTIKPQLSE
ncbi:MAG: gliding motility-associated protein GldE [Deinococcales bacterium]|nr:gliding motility-associated protein GldE [Chitinophagaceae bacterium]